MGERVPAPRRLGRAEALAELALRYFTGHGPATERDLAYWATLTLTDVRAGLGQVRDRLDSFQHDGRTFWHAPGDAPGGPQQPAAHLLQILDETYRGYQDSRWVLDTAGDVPRTRETATGMALVDAQLIAAMRRTVADDHVRFDLRPYRALTPAEIEALDQAASGTASTCGSTPGSPCRDPRTRSPQRQMRSIVASRLSSACRRTGRRVRCPPSSAGNGPGRRPRPSARLRSGGERRTDRSGPAPGRG